MALVGGRGRRWGGVEVVRVRCLVSTLHFARFLVLAALLVVVGAGVARVPSRSDADEVCCGRRCGVDTSRLRERRSPGWRLLGCCVLWRHRDGCF
jgi:hypothetical protein